MGKLTGFVRLQGTLDGLTFYKSKNGLLVRTKGGVSKERIMNDPAYARTRENGTEFGNAATAGKLLRVSANTIIASAKDGELTARLTKVMTQVKNLDTTSDRGLRTVANGIATAAGKQLFKGFNLNSKAHLSSVLRTPYAVDTATGEITIVGFVPQTELSYPPHATHVSLTCAFLNVDFVTGIYEIALSPVFNTAIDMHPSTVALTPSAVPAGTGIQFYFLLVEYFQEVNGREYPLNNGAFNALAIVEVI